MRYFSESEFNGWFDDLSDKQKKCLDTFRDLWGHPVSVSPVPGAVGRNKGSSKSMHNIDRYKEVRATDVFPSNLSLDNLQHCVDCAKKAGFTGVGVYTQAKPTIMLHLDTRDGSRVATWSAWRKGSGWEYKAITAANVK